MVVYCPRCGARGEHTARFCYLCSDGEADEARAEELVAALASGQVAAKRILEDIRDPRAFPAMTRAVTTETDPEVRRAALMALGGIGDPRGIPIAAAALDDTDDRVRRAAIDALAEMGPGGADAIADRLADPRDRTAAARAMAFLRDDRAFEPLELMLDSETLVAEAALDGGTILAIGRLGGPRAIAALATAADRVIVAADSGVPDWQVRHVASTVGQTLVDMRNPRAEDIYERLAERFGHLYVIPVDLPAPYVAPPHPRRTVPRWSFSLQSVDEPITEPVSKFGGQPVWVGVPAWPLATDGGPATFIAQFTIPGQPGLAYVFLDYEASDNGDEPGILFVQPGPGPERTVSIATGPTFWTEVRGRPTRYVPKLAFRRIESLAVLEPGLDFDDWDLLNLDPETSRDDDRDWNKIGGNPRWLQGDEMPEEPGWRFLFQFTAAKMGFELADGAEVYGLIHDDGRGRFIVHSH